MWELGTGGEEGVGSRGLGRGVVLEFLARRIGGTVGGVATEVGSRTEGAGGS